MSKGFSCVDDEAGIVIDADWAKDNPRVSLAMGLCTDNIPFIFLAGEFEEILSQRGSHRCHWTNVSDQVTTY